MTVPYAGPETVVHRTFLTDEAGLIGFGDLFEYQPSLDVEEGGHYKVFRFRGHVVAASGEEWVSCYGGDPDPKGRRAWRSFHVEDIKAGAKTVRPAWREKRV